MKHKIAIVSLVAMFMFCFISAPAVAQDFVRGGDIPFPENDKNTGGTGNMIAGEDLDNDGNVEIYLVNNNWNDTADELIPRIYKLEKAGESWEVVWSAVAPVPKQNTWPPLLVSDLDNDGKKEIIWMVINYTDAENPNPYRVLVYEAAGDGSDDMGVADGDNFLPNSAWTIVSEDNVNLRPFRAVLADPDMDGTTEIVFADRKGTDAAGGHFFGVISVDDIPDNADGSESWTLEVSGKDFDIPDHTENKWDVAVLDSTIYLFDEVVCTRVSYANGDWTLLPDQSSVLAGAGSWKGAQVLDIDGNAQQEIIAGSWYDGRKLDGHGIFIYQYSEEGDSLVGEKIADLSPYIADDAYGTYGGAVGDVDLDGQVDYVFGSRTSDPHAAIFRLEYQGAQDEVMNSALWELSVIDSNYAEGGRWGIIDVANIDEDANQEVLYTSSVPAGTFPDVGTQPIVILDNTEEIPTGPWHEMELDYTYKGVLDTVGGAHGIVVDPMDRVWVGGFFGENLHVIDPATGDRVMTIDSVSTQTPDGQDTTIVVTNCRGMNVDLDGNIIYAQSGAIMKFDSNDGTLLDWLPFDGSPLKPAIDSDGFIYVGLVVGVSPVSVIDPSTFEITQTITLDPLAGGFARGMEVSPDGKRLFPCNLAGGPHPVYIYETQDFVNYPLADSILYDDMGNPILTQQTVTVDWSRDGKLWYSQDNSYGSGGPDQLENALVMFDFDKMNYGYLWMPDPGTSDYTGPRGVAWSQDGKTAYVANFNAGAIYIYDTTPVSLKDDNGNIVTTYDLEQNYPNPFNPVTNIKFTVAKAGKVTLKVYNMLGQEVATLVDKNMPRGQFTVQFDGSNLASGMYVYELQAKDFNMSRKMMLIK